MIVPIVVSAALGGYCLGIAYERYWNEGLLTTPKNGVGAAVVWLVLGGANIIVTIAILTS